VELWYRSVPVGAPTTVTPTLSGSVANTVVVSEWANITLGVSPTTNSSTTTASPNDTGSETPVVAGDLVIGAFAVNSATARTISVGNELTKPTLPASFNTATGYVIAPDTAAEDIQWTTASAASTAGVSALFRCTSTGGPPATTPFIGWGWGVNV
jgi:hypothetical protein